MSFISNNKAFTLIELLVTTAILGILAATSIAIFDQFKTKAYNVETLSAYRQIIQIAYALENEIVNAPRIAPHQAALSSCNKSTTRDIFCMV